MTLALIQSTSYRSKIRAIRNGIACSPVWTVTIPREEDDFCPVSRRMFIWLYQNIDKDSYDIHKRSAMSWSFEAVTFDHHEDAMLFYLAFA